ncbi:hypothetical protein [Microlunatus sp. GCM10028923]|uniref:aspartate racemase/maleate isomerase family protein n=1 Tax=Microlunatus sp. GCM10028923 TaxID=3273400 RepID=UPI0036731DFC
MERLAIGVLTPHVAAGPEVEWPAMAGGRVTVRREPVGPAGPEHALARFGDGSVGALAYASTSTGYALGHRAETELIDRLAQRSGVPVVAGAAAAVLALRSFRTERVTLVHPPWFDLDLDRLGVGYFHDQGFDATVIRAAGLPGDPSRVRTTSVIDDLGPRLKDGDDPVFLAGHGFRAAGAIDALERSTGRRVLQANQVVLWAILAAIRPAWTITGYGSLFA